MATPKIDPKVIFSSNAPAQDKPAAFANYEKGMDATRANEGRPTIKQANYLQMTTDQKILWIHENGGALPYDSTIDYAEGAIVKKDGVLQEFLSGEWVSLEKPLTAENLTDGNQTQDQINLYGGKKYDMPVGGYPLNARVLLDNGDIVKSTIDENTNNPNSDMTGWLVDNSQTRATVTIFEYFTVTERNAYLASPNTYDASAQIQKSFNSIAGKELDLLGLEFKVGSRVMIQNSSNFVLRNGGITALNTLPSTANNQVLVFKLNSRFSVQNFKVDGNRLNRSMLESTVHNIHLLSCSLFTFVNVDSNNSICDALYMISDSVVNADTVPSHGMFFNCKFDNSARNNLSIIVGKKLVFNNCEFTGANGISPQAGVDIESNNYGAIDVLEDIVFNNCYLARNKGWQASIVEFDKPKGIRFNGGTIISNQGGFTGSNTGGIHIINEDTILNGVTFKDFTTDSGFAVRISAVPKSYGVILNCFFRDMAGNGLIQSHAASEGVCAFGNTFDNCTVEGIVLNGKQNIIERNTFRNSAGITATAQAGIVEIVGNIMRNTTSNNTAAIFSSATGTKIIDNKMFDTTASRYIQSEAAGVIIDDNYIANSVSEPTKRGIRFNGNNAKSVQRNTMINLHSTNPLEIIGTAPYSTKIAGNSGGLANNTSDFFTSASVTLPAVAASAQASVNISVVGAFVGMQVGVSFSANMAGSQIWAEVTGVNTVTIYRRNATAAALPELVGTAHLRLNFG